MNIPEYEIPTLSEVADTPRASGDITDVPSDPFLLDPAPEVWCARHGKTCPYGCIR